MTGCTSTVGWTYCSQTPNEPRRYIAFKSTAVPMCTLLPAPNVHWQLMCPPNLPQTIHTLPLSGSANESSSLCPLFLLQLDSARWPTAFHLTPFSGALVCSAMKGAISSVSRLRSRESVRSNRAGSQDQWRFEGVLFQVYIQDRP